MFVFRRWLWLVCLGFGVTWFGACMQLQKSSRPGHATSKMQGSLSLISADLFQPTSGEQSPQPLNPTASQTSPSPHKTIVKQPAQKTDQPAQKTDQAPQSRSVALSKPRRKVAMTVQPSGKRRTWELVPEPLPTPKTPAPQPQEQRGDLAYWARLQRTLGDNVWQAGVAYQTSLQTLQNLCNRPDAPAEKCSIYWRSQRIFAINYKTKPSNYRGYITFHKQRKRRIPRHLMRWYHRLSSKRFEKTGDQCYIKEGLLSNCMTFAICAQKSAMWNFKGHWGEGFGYPYWGRVQYLTSQAYYRHFKDYEKNGETRPGVQTLMRSFADLDLNEKRLFSRRLLLDIYDTYMKMVRRRSRKLTTHNKYRKAFCSNIVVNAGSFKRALPGDLFGLMYVYKSLHPSDNRYRYQFQHWGLIVNPETKYVLHNQTPGGLWGKNFKEWGIQFGRFPKLLKEWSWHEKTQSERRMMFVVHRLNLHYFIQARQNNTTVYSTDKPQFCRTWINRHADLYFTDMSATLPSPSEPSSDTDTP